jgi:hypothetical protein
MRRFGMPGITAVHRPTATAPDRGGTGGPAAHRWVVVCPGRFGKLIGDQSIELGLQQFGIGQH